MKLLTRAFILASAAAGLSWFNPAVAACEPQRVAQKYPKWAGKIVTVATSPIQRPYSFTDPTNPTRLVGFEVEVNERVFACAGLKFEYIITDQWSGLLAGVASGRAAAAISAVNYNPDRASRVDYVTYYNVMLSAIVASGNPKRVKSLDDLCGLTSGYRAGSSSSVVVDRQQLQCEKLGKPRIVTVPAQNTESEYRGVENGRIDVFLDDAVASSFRRAQFTDPKFELAFRMTDRVTPVGVVVTKGDETLARMYSDGLKELEVSGELAAIFKKYAVDPQLITPIAIRTN